jgi:HlyD family secretion protein
MTSPHPHSHGALGPAVAALLLATACGRDDPARGAIVVSGHVEGTDVRVGTKVGGTLTALLVEEGETVAAGQEIARIDTVDLELALASARAELATARADLDLGLAGFREEEIAEARAGVARAEADLVAAEKDLVRMEGLLASGSGTPKMRDDALARRDVGTALLAAARERLRRLESGSRPEEIAVARARLAAAEARVAQLEQRLRDAVVASPIAGVVTAKLAERGEIVAPGAPLAVITDLAGAWLNVWLAEPELGRVPIGRAVEVRTDDGRTRQGIVRSIASTAEFTPKNVQTADERVKLVFKVKIGLDNADGTFKPGMPAEARIEPVESP